MQVINSRFEPAVSVQDLRPHPRNPRSGDVGAIFTSIQENGFYGACIVQDSTGYILAGNHRFQAALHAGATDVPVIFVDVDDKHALQILLADNRSNDIADYDVAALSELLAQFQAEYGTLAGTLYDAEAVAAVNRDLEGYTANLAGAAADAVQTASTPATEVSPGSDNPASRPPPAESSAEDAAADEVVDQREKLQEKWKVVRGDVWQVGVHRLMCGDSTLADDVDKLLAGEAPEWVWTDPPYGVSYQGKTAVAMEIKNDGGEDLDKLLAGAFAQCNRVMAPGAPIYVAHPHGPKSRVFGQEFERAGFHWHQTLVWVKNAIVLGHSDYHYRHEPILYGWKKNPDAKKWEGSLYNNHPWHGAHTQATVLEFSKPSRSDLHPTTKPTGLIAKCLENSSALGSVGYEPFSGSGTTLLAAHELGRVCRAMELDPRYVAVCLERASLLGIVPERIG